jgi:hypothetical protein
METDGTLVDWRRSARTVGWLAVGCALGALVLGMVPGVRPALAVGIGIAVLVVSTTTVLATSAVRGMRRAEDRLAGGDVGLMPTPARRAVARRRQKRGRA